MRSRRLLRLSGLAGWILVAACGGASAPDPPSRPAAELSRPARTVMRTAVLSLVDRRRTIRRRDGSVVARRITTVVRYPRVTGGTAADRARRYPLVVFGHGYALSPASYRPLLSAWSRAGYVVAAPAFPGERAGAPGGPNRGDLINQPADVRFVIDRLLRASARGRGTLGGLVDPTRIAVAGHSDGGDTALAVAYDNRFRSRRVDAAIILAGADLPGIAPFRFPRRGPPLLAVQGTADTVNPPADTDRFFVRAPAPKALLRLLGAGHFGPYMTQRDTLRIVERVTIAFLDRTLKARPITDAALRRLGRRRGLSDLVIGG